MVAIVETEVKPIHETDRYCLLSGDCRIALRALADSYVDSVICDPPYHLTQMSRAGQPRNNDPETPFGRTRIGERGFMGKTWDGGDVAHDPAVWSECLRVLKPGGHLLAFGGSRTYHRLACAIEDAGFEIRDQIMWLYGSGFPKSLDVSKAIDAAAGAEREVVGANPTYRKDQVAPTSRNLQRNPHLTAHATDAAKQWDGWGTALKPAHEPIVLARKPLLGTVAENVLQHGTGGLNIDGCRVEANETITATRNYLAGAIEPGGTRKAGDRVFTEYQQHAQGRWPTNVIHDGSEEVLAGFPETQSGAMRPTHTNARRQVYGQNAAKGYTTMETYGDAGSAARFFYTAKASQEDRNEGLETLPHRVSDDVHKRPRTELDDPRRHGVTPRQNFHPTVKPTGLMQYLCRLVTPPGGIVLDPFCGSGSTGKAAMLEGFRFIGIELNADYIELAQRRIEAVTKQGRLFA